MINHRYIYNKHVMIFEKYISWNVYKYLEISNT